MPICQAIDLLHCGVHLLRSFCNCTCSCCKQRLPKSRINFNAIDFQLVSFEQPISIWFDLSVPAFLVDPLPMFLLSCNDSSDAMPFQNQWESCMTSPFVPAKSGEKKCRVSFRQHSHCTFFSPFPMLWCFWSHAQNTAHPHMATLLQSSLSHEWIENGQHHFALRTPRDKKSAVEIKNECRQSRWVCLENPREKKRTRMQMNFTTGRTFMRTTFP